MNYSIVIVISINAILDTSCVELRYYNRDSDNIQTGLINLPNHITHLKLLKSDYTILILPYNLISLEIEEPIIFNEIINLPENLEYLTIPHNYTFKLPYNNLNNIKEIKLIGKNNDIYLHVQELFEYCYTHNIKLISHIKNDNTKISIDEVLNDIVSNYETYLNNDGSINRKLIMENIKYIEIGEIQYNNYTYYVYNYKIFRSKEDIYNDKYIGLYINEVMIEFNI